MVFVEEKWIVTRKFSEKPCLKLRTRFNGGNLWELAAHFKEIELQAEDVEEMLRKVVYVSLFQIF